MLGPGGFNAGRDIAAITVNRWSHGYSYTANSLYEDKDDETVMEAARATVGHVAIANCDAQWDPYAHSAIDQAARAVRELVS
jgi:spermidine dehydrogenase